MNSFLSVALIVAVCVLSSQAAPPNYPPPAYGGAGYGGAGYAVPPLPPFGAPALHPKYGHGYGGYGSDYKPQYITALRYESTTQTPYRTDSAYAYQVDGQSVQVAKVDTHKSYGY